MNKESLRRDKIQVSSTLELGKPWGGQKNQRNPTETEKKIKVNQIDQFDFGFCFIKISVLVYVRFEIVRLKGSTRR